MGQRKKIITPDRRIGLKNYLLSIWDFRYLTFTLAKSEIKSQYALTYTGIFLSIIQTLVGLGVYWLVFGIGLKVDTGNIPYPLFALTGIILWQYFTYLVGSSSGALLDSEHLITKLYFPRINLVFSKAISGVIDLATGFILIIIFYLIYGFHFHVLWLLAPLLIIVLVMSALSIGIWVSIISLFIRDVGRIIIHMMNFIIFITPVFYPGTVVPDGFKFILYINPLAGVIAYMRSILFETSLPPNEYLIGFIPVVILFFSGIWYYKHLEKRITDLL